MWTCLSRESLDLVVFETGGVRELVRGSLPQPDGAGAQAEGGEGFDEGDLSCLYEVERSTHRSDDRGEAVHLDFARAVLLVDMVQVATRDGGGETLGHILETALRERDDLVVMRL